MAYYLGKTVLIRGVYSATEARIAVEFAAETQPVQEAVGQRNLASLIAPNPKPSLAPQAVAPGIPDPGEVSDRRSSRPTIAPPTQPSRADDTSTSSTPAIRPSGSASRMIPVAGMRSSRIPHSGRPPQVAGPTGRPVKAVSSAKPPSNPGVPSRSLPVTEPGH